MLVLARVGWPVCAIRFFLTVKPLAREDGGRRMEDGTQLKFVQTRYTYGGPGDNESTIYCVLNMSNCD